MPDRSQGFMTWPAKMIDPRPLEIVLFPKYHPSTQFQSVPCTQFELLCVEENARSVFFSFWAFASSHGSKNRRPLSHLSWRNAVFTSRSQNGQVSGGRTYPPGLFPTGGITFLLFAQATTTSTQPTTTTTTTTTATTFAQGWLLQSCQQFCGWGP